MKNLLVYCLACLLLLVRSCMAFPLYEDKTADIAILSSWDEFSSTVMKESGGTLWMIQFCTSDEQKCVQLVETYLTIAKMMKGILHLGVVDVSSEGGEAIASQLNIAATHLPTVYWFLDDKERPQKIDQSLELQAMISNGMETIAKVLSDRAQKMGLGVEFSKDNKQQKKSGRKASPGSATVTVSGEQEFEEKVILNPLVSLVAFTAPWCGHCKMLKPDWDEAAEKVQGQGAQLVWVDATDPVNEGIAAQFQVQGFPSIFVFPGGAPKVAQQARQYPGERKTSAIVQYVLEEVDRTGIPKEIPELTNESILKEECAGHNHICVLAALPALETAEKRNRYKDLITSVSKTFRGSAFSFLWFEGGKQPSLEHALDLTFGFPALVAYSMDRNAFAVLRGSFSEKQMTSFLHGVTSGRTSVVKLKQEKEPKIETTEPWDGNDAPVFEEEFSLDDIMGPDDDETKEEL